jgi:mono/diheme cytochrome c family protein
MTEVDDMAISRFPTAVVLAFVIQFGSNLNAADPAGAEEVVFARDIQPLLAKHCLVCHGPDKSEAGLKLNSAEQAGAKLDSEQRAIVPGQPIQSELLRRVRATGDERMPPEGDPLSSKDIELLEQWIRQGAEFAEHWAYQPLTQPSPPKVQNEAWIRSPIDRYVLAKLERSGIAPSSEPGRATFVKRLYYDLLGLPPTLQEVDAFVRDDRPAAYEQLVDRLLASEHFGERWGRHWLDKARYADSDGYEKDRPRPNAWRYRDWVINAINRDMPFDQFTIEQLAGDLLPDASPTQKLATAFHRQTLTNTEGGTDKEEFRVEATFDRTETTSAIWMGLTMTCARCHTHKYDQITQHEYYQLFAFFNNSNEANIDADAIQTERTNRSAAQPGAIASPVAADHPETVKPVAELAALKKKSSKSPETTVRVMTSAERKTRVLHRGDFLQPADEVQPDVLAVISRTHPLKSRYEEKPADRLDLAGWLADANHPLTARVTVNQVWSHLFGHGIVRTLNDFGVRGDMPTHPELLDWLAWKLSRDMQWSRKALIKSIVMSATYRQSSDHRPRLRSIDPTNRLLARQNRVRVEAEVVRDLYLAVSGLLSKHVGGPSVFPPLPPGVAELSYANNFKWKTSEGEDRYRRGMYTFFKRTSPHPTLISFDCPDSNTTRLRRDSSNTPLQALATLNNDVFTESAQALAQRVLANGGDDDVSRLTFAIRLCTIREPEGEQVQRFSDLLNSTRAFYQRHPADANLLTKRHAAKDVTSAENAAWVATLRIVLNLDEFIVRD